MSQEEAKAMQDSGDLLAPAQAEKDIQNPFNLQSMDNSLGFLGLGQAKQAQQDIPILLELNRQNNDEFQAVIGGGFQGNHGLSSNLEETLKKYDISKPEVTRENKFSLIAIEQ